MFAKSLFVPNGNVEVTDISSERERGRIKEKNYITHDKYWMHGV